MASQLGISIDTLKYAKKLANLPVEIQQLVEEGKITASTASRVIAGLSEAEKRK